MKFSTVSDILLLLCCVVTVTTGARVAKMCYKSAEDAGCPSGNNETHDVIRFYLYNDTEGIQKCEMLGYDGCHAKPANGFPTMKKCVDACNPGQVVELCKQPKAGHCRRKETGETRFFYDPATDRCKKFQFCDENIRNENNFVEKKLCEAYCRGLPK